MYRESQNAQGDTLTQSSGGKGPSQKTQAPTSVVNCGSDRTPRIDAFLKAAVDTNTASILEITSKTTDLFLLPWKDALKIATMLRNVEVIYHLALHGVSDGGLQGRDFNECLIVAVTNCDVVSARFFLSQGATNAEQARACVDTEARGGAALLSLLQPICSVIKETRTYVESIKRATDRVADNKRLRIDSTLAACTRRIIKSAVFVQCGEAEAILEPAEPTTWASSQRGMFTVRSGGHRKTSISMKRP